MVRPPKVLDIQVRDHCYRLQPLDTFTPPPVPNTKAHFGCQLGPEGDGKRMIQYLPLGDRVKGQEQWNWERQSLVRIEQRDTKMARGRFQGKKNKEALVHLFRQNQGRGKLKIQVYCFVLGECTPSSNLLCIPRQTSFEVNDQPSSCMEGIVEIRFSTIPGKGPFDLLLGRQKAHMPAPF